MNIAGSAVKIEINDESRWNILQKKAQEARVVRAFDLFRKQGIEPILIKGLAAARNYPESRTRLSIDMDLAVSAPDYEAALQIARSDAADGLAVDLHRELRHLDTAEWSDLFDNSRLLNIDGGTVRVLRPEDHLRVLCVHWLIDGGRDKDRLWDIYYAIENRPPDFDWDRLLNTVEGNRRRWLICTIGLASRYLGLDLDDTPIKEEARNLPAWLTKTVEREWASETRELALEFSVHDPKILFEQLKKRLRPNPIRATVEMEGSFDAKTRVYYQIGNTFSRVMPTYRRIRDTIKLRIKGV